MDQLIIQLRRDFLDMPKKNEKRLAEFYAVSSLARGEFRQVEKKL